MNAIANLIKSLVTSIINFAKRRRVVSAVLAIILLVTIVSLVKTFNKIEVLEEIASIPLVEVKSVREMISGRLFTAVGTVKAVSEARLQTESGGRVTAVLTEIGATVKAGSILATLENSSERASLLQAEGAYEAALASAAQGDIGTREADIRFSDALKDSQSTSNSTYGTVLDVLINTVDGFYANPDTSFPSLRLSTYSNVDFLSNERKSLQTTLASWNQFAFNSATNEAIYQHVDFAKEQISRIINLIDIFRTAVNGDINDSRYSDVERAIINASLTAARSQLVSASSALDTSKSGLMTAVEGKERAQIGATSGVTSAANAQLKQALGTYRSAQANYEKTVVRTPITGLVNALYLKAGEYASPSAPAAIVANNNGLEIATAVNQDDSLKLTIGDIVTIDKTATGTINAIAGAIDPTTGKVALKISLNNNSEIQNGTTVSIGFEAQTQKTEVDITIPLSAIKMTGSGPVVFSVGDNKELTAIPVVLGPVNGNNVLIEEGINFDSQIVVDARGLKAGEIVTISEK